MDHLLGLLRLAVVRGVNLAYRDARGSDPYVVVEFAGQKLKTTVKNKEVNPEWNEDLTLTVSDPTRPIKFEVYDKDLLTRDDKMGDAELDIQPFVDAAHMVFDSLPDNSVIKSVLPSRQNCLANESKIIWKDGRVVQDVILRLRNVECGELEVQLAWVTLLRV